MKKPQFGDQTRGSRPFHTGRYFVIQRDWAADFKKTEALLRIRCGFRMAHSADFKAGRFTEELIRDADAFVYDELGIALISGDSSQLQILEAEKDDFTLAPEKVLHVPEDIPSTVSAATTWGIEVTGVAGSPFTGKDIKVAVLDTGFDTGHPDFEGRQVVTHSFADDETADDVHGHGTHTIGTACGSADSDGQRYGVATESIIYVGKVLNAQGSGAESWLLDGIAWAADEGCKVISMSLGTMVSLGEEYSPAFERAAQSAMSKGAILVAAAGNESNRSGDVFQPINSPANCPSILAVGALDQELNIADFSNRSINPGQEIAIAGPGVDIHSSYPEPERYRTLSGTSMSTPHVAGILALLWERTPDASPDQLIAELHELARELSLPAIDAGSGLVIAPLSSNTVT